MNETRITIQQTGREITLIGTAHVSRESINEVEAVIREIKPEMVCVELDAGRYESLSKKEQWESLDVAKVIREGRGYLLLANLVLSSFQRRVGLGLDVRPGEELLIAVQTAQELGIPYRFCDRQISITMRRAWASCSWWSKNKLLASLVSSVFSKEPYSETEIEELKTRSELEGITEELAKFLPEIKKTLIDERDSYLAAKIWQEGIGLSSDSGIVKQVAVVGMGHIAGIKSAIERIADGQEGYDVEELDKIPPKGRISKGINLLFPAFILVTLALGFIKAGAGVSVEMLLRWLLLNGSLAAVGSAIALGHPLAILVSFVTAPIGTLSPVLSVGFFSGIVEATMRKPRVADTQRIMDDILSLKGIYSNRITRALLVFFLSSLGGAVGNFISIPALTRLLFIQ